MTKKIIAILAAILITASLASCGNGDKPDEDTTGNKININEQTTEADTSNQIEITTEETTDIQEETTEDPSGDMRNADPGEFTYIDQNDMVYVMNKINNLPLRSGDFEYLAEFKNGTVLQRTGISEDGRWSRVIFGGIEGYVATRNITTYNPNGNSFEAVQLTLTAATALNVRIYPDFPVGIYDDDESYCNVAGQILEGGVVTVIGHDATNGWYKVEYTPAEGILEAGYSYEFFVKADNSYFVETQETETTEEVTTEPVEEIVIPDGYKLNDTEHLSFAVPSDWTVSSDAKLIIGGSNSITVKNEAYTEDSEKTYFSMSESIFNEKIAPQYTDKGMTVAELSIAQGKRGSVTVTTLSFTTTLDGVVSYVTQFYVHANEDNVVIITVTEVGQKAGVAAVVDVTINVK